MQLPTIINDLNKIGISLKSLSSLNIGVVGVNTGNIQAYQAAIKGLSAEQSVFALATKGATEAQIEEIMTTETATLAKETYTQADIQAALAKNSLITTSTVLTVAQQEELINSGLLTHEKMAEIAATIGLTRAEDNSLVSKSALNIEMVKQQLASIGIVGSTQKQILAMLGLTTAEGGTIATTNILTASFAKLWAIISAHPIGALITAIGVVSVGVITYINKATNKAKEALVEVHKTAEQVLNDTKASLSNDKSELQSLNSELETTKGRLKEISSIGAPTLTEQSELNKLSTANAQLEAQKTLLENNIRLKQKSAALKAKKLLETQVEMQYSDILDNSSIISRTESYTYGEHAQYQAHHLQNAYNIYMGALRDGDIKRQELAQELIDASSGDAAILTSELLDIVESFKYDDGTIIEGYEDIYNHYMGIVYNLQSLTNPDVFLNIAKSITAGTGIDYEKAISEAYKLAYEGNFDIASIDQEFVKALTDAGIDESTINYIFKLKQQEYQLLVDRINAKYDPSKVQFTYWDGNGNIHRDYEREEPEKEQIEKINQELNDYAKENPIEFQLISSYDKNFELLDQFIEEERTKAETNVDYVGDYIANAINRIYNEAKSQIFTLNEKALNVNPTSSLSDIENAYSSLEDIFEEIESGGTVSASSIDELTEKFGELNDGKSLENFRKVLTTMPDDIDACKKALNQLATEYLDQSDLIKNLTVENAKYVESELRKLGVENAQEVVRSRLIQHDYSEADAQAELIEYSRQLTDAKHQEEIASLDLANATADDIAGLINEANAAGVNTVALQSYLRQKLSANATILSTNGDITNLLALVTALGGAGDALTKYQNAKQQILEGKSPTGYWKSDEYYLEHLKKEAENEIRDALSGTTTANVSYNPYMVSGGSAGGSGASEAKDTTKQYNWIETAINRVQDALSRLTKVRDDTYTSWTKRNAALNQEIAKTTEEINLQQRAYENYMAKANSIGLSQDYINKIQSGTIQIEDITDEGLQEKIDQYQDWYDKAVSCSDAIQDLKLSLSQLAQQKFDNLQQEYDSLISTVTAQADVINERMNRTEEQGYFADKTYYQQLTQYETQELAALRQEYAALQSSLQDAVATGRITEGSQAWSDMRKNILSVEQAIEESTTALVEYNNAMRDLDWEIFDYIHERIQQITQESDFLIDLLENSKLYEDNGTFNAEGKAAAALHGINYNTYLQQSLDYAKELKNIESDLAKDQNNRDLIDRREELLKLQQESIVNAEAEKEAIKSLVEDGIDLHLEALSELIDKYKESLDAAKDLYDYQKNITQQTANIADLEKILMAYEGDDSEETRKRIQDTRNQLEEARQELQETEWDKYISETEDLLDALYEDYETILNERLDNIDALIETMIEMVNASGSEIRDTISDTTAKVGYDITHTLDTIFGNGGKQTTLISSFMNKFETASTTLQTAINDIKNSIHAMMATPGVSESAGGTSNSVGSSSNASVSGNTSSGAATAAGQAQLASASPQGDGIANVGDLVTYISGKYHEDSWGNGRSGSQNLNGQVYITKIKAGSPYPYHISRGSTLGNGDLGWVSLDQLQGYKTGARRISNAQYAWLHEDGSELIRTSDGALLTRLGQGDMVFTNEMSQRLWEISKGMLPHSASTDVNLSNLLPYADRQGGVINNSNDITIQLPNVTNYAEFKRELQKDSKFAGFVQEITLGQASGRPRLNSNRY